MQCDQKMACEADGGKWDPYMTQVDGALPRPTAIRRTVESIDTDARGRGLAAAPTLPPVDLTGFTPAQVGFAAAAWPMRAAEELRSALIFRALARAAGAAKLPEPWTKRFEAMVVDEIGHARLCAEVGSRLGAERPQYDARPVRARLTALTDPLGRTTAILLVEAAMGETISMALFRAGRRAATEPLTRAALSAILADEVRHQRNGWTGMTALWPSLSGPATRGAAARGDERPRGVRAPGGRAGASPSEAGEPFDPAFAALGVLAPEARVDAFYRAVEHLVVPRLTALGLDGARAWSERYRR